ncbi:hypothetical protein LCL97_13930 [Seohaeicola saemankumensis]|nr:hypothetical protein [Seohaeicola saemankumensis]MCA0871934.1 hypothetical protein [Seohaeicola saemankumensis]
MRSALAVQIICLWLCPAAWAGAWLQEPGKAFLAVTATLRRGAPQAQFENTIYGEYGLAPRLTLGIDINQRPVIAGHALLFIRTPLGSGTTRNRFAFEAAVGGYHWMGQWQPMYKTALSMGRSITVKGIPGWLAVDAAIERRIGTPAPTAKLDATLGLSGAARVQPILQIETARTSGLPLMWTVTPGITVKGPKETTWVIGIERKSVIRQTIGIKLGFWRRF